MGNFIKDIRKTIEKHKIIFITLAILTCFMLVLLIMYKLLFTPYKLEVSRNSTLYQYEKITKDDIDVQAITRLGKSQTITDYEFTDAILYDTNTNMEIQWKKLKTTFNCVAVGYSSTVATYNFPDITYQGDEVDKDNLKVVYSYVDGSKHEQTDYEITDNPDYFNSNKLVIKTDAGEATLKCKKYVELVDMQTSRQPIIYSGETLGNKLDYIRIDATYADGTVRSLKGSDVTVEDKPLTLGNNTITVDYHGSTHEIQLEVTVKEGVATIIYGKYSEEQYNGDKFKFDSILVEYKDGTSDQIPYTEVKFNEALELSYGTNTFTWVYNDKTFTFTITALEREIKKAELLGYTAYTGREPKVDRVMLTFDNDKQLEVSGTDIQITSGTLTKDDKTIEIVYHNRSCEADIEVEKLEIIDIRIPSTTKIFEKNTIPNCNMTIYFNDNTTEVVKPSDLGIDNKVMTLGNNVLNIEYKGTKYELIVNAIKDTIVSTTYSCKKEIYEGDTIPKLLLTIVFDSGNIETISSDKVEFSRNTYLRAGINTINYIYKDCLGVINLDVLETPVISDDNTDNNDNGDDTTGGNEDNTEIDDEKQNTDDSNNDIIEKSITGI